MKILLDAADERAQFFGPDMINITNISTQEKMLTLSSITTLTIEIQRDLCSWVEFQNQLAITAEAIVEVCVQK